MCVCVCVGEAVVKGGLFCTLDRKGRRQESTGSQQLDRLRCVELSRGSSKRGSDYLGKPGQSPRTLQITQGTWGFLLGARRGHRGPPRRVVRADPGLSMPVSLGGKRVFREQADRLAAEGPPGWGGV